mgnify:FL=1
MFSIHFLLCNLTISILLGIILLLKKLLKNYITTNSRYYLWYIFVCALIIPFIPFKNIGPHQLLIKLQHFFQQDTGKIVNTSTKQLDDINLSVIVDILTKSVKSPASIAKSNKLWMETLYLQQYIL